MVKNGTDLDSFAFFCQSVVFTINAFVQVALCSSVLSMSASPTLPAETKDTKKPAAFPELLEHSLVFSSDPKDTKKGQGDAISMCKTRSIANFWSAEVWVTFGTLKQDGVDHLIPVAVKVRARSIALSTR